jgi:hypothetical protein
MTLPPGQSQHLSLPALACRCARCHHFWVVFPREVGLAPNLPARCPQCDTRNWNRAPRRRGPRPRQTAAA